MMILKSLRRVLVPVITLLLSTSALAQTATVESRLRDKLRLQTQELASLKAQQAGHQAELAQVQKERDDLKAKAAGRPVAVSKPVVDRASASQLAELRQRAEAAEQQLAGKVADLTKSQADYEALRQQAQTVIDKLETAARAPDEKLTKQLAGKDQQLDDLYKTATEIADLYNNEAFVSKIRGGGLGALGYSSIKVQNQMETYRKKLYDQRFPKEVPLTPISMPSADQATTTEGPPK
jgi:colicin import membrane protein